MDQAQVARNIADGTTQWVQGGAQRGWTRKTGPIQNLDLWRQAVESASKHAVYWRWVRGHAGHAQNEYANDLAVRAAGDQSSSGGLVESGFDTWLAPRLEKTKPVTLEAFPDPAIFRASRALPTAHPTSP